MKKHHTKKVTRTKHSEAIHRKPHKETHEEKQPEYMVQVNDPKMLRKDVLESLREVIIFMQGYEKFRRIQEEKIALFSALKADIKDLNSLIENKLKRCLPQGKLRGIVKATSEPEEETEEKEVVKQPVPEEAPKKQKMPPVVEERKIPVNELDELESQLKDIESQLRNIK